MTKLEAIFYDLLQDSTDSPKVQEAWGKVTELVEPRFDTKDYLDVEEAIVAHSTASEYQGFQMGFKYASELWKELSV